jgi:mRNA interferase RelE/StbE
VIVRYTVEFDTKAAKEIRVLAQHQQGRIIAMAQALADNPRPTGCTKLAGESGLYRIRSGNYRIIYQIQDARLVITVVKVGHRRDVYRGV